MTSPGNHTLLTAHTIWSGRDDVTKKKLSPSTHSWPQC